jgi:hypothetical protein
MGPLTSTARGDDGIVFDEIFADRGETLLTGALECSLFCAADSLLEAVDRSFAVVAVPSLGVAFVAVLPLFGREYFHAACAIIRAVQSERSRNAWTKHSDIKTKPNECKRAKYQENVILFVLLSLSFSLFVGGMCIDGDMT